MIFNPPFQGDNIEHFVDRALALMKDRSGIVAAISPLRRIPSAAWLKESGCTKIVYMTPRPSMPTGEYIMDGGKVGGGQQDYCWLIWDRSYSGPAPISDWLDLGRKTNARKRTISGGR